MKKLFPESFPPGRSDEASRELLLYNSYIYAKPWDMMSKVSNYALQVEHGEEIHSNILTNVVKEAYLIGSLLYPELDEEMEYLDKRADEVNSRQGTFNYVVGTFTKDYFLDMLFLLRSGFKGSLKAAAKYEMSARKALKYTARMGQEVRKLKRKGKSFEEINHAIFIKALEIVLEYTGSKSAGNAMEGVTKARKTTDKIIGYSKNISSFATKVAIKESIKYKNSFLDSP